MMLKKTLKFISETLKVVIISLVVILPVRYFLFQPFYVMGASMEPSFFDREYLIIDEISYRFNAPERGDVVIFRYPENQREFFIKRIVGLPEEGVEIRNGSIYVYNSDHQNGFMLPEPYLGTDISTAGDTDGIIRLKADEYYVLGDNRDFSLDSREFGPVKSDLIKGRAVFRGWPLKRVDVLRTPDYGIN